MSWKNFKDDCPGCKPVLFDPRTRRVLSADSPEMQAIDQVWAQTTRVEREAFHRFTCLNSRTPEDFQVIQELSERMNKAMKATDEVPIEEGKCTWHLLTGPRGKAVACARCGGDLLHCERCARHIKCASCGTEGRQTN